MSVIAKVLAGIAAVGAAALVTGCDPIAMKDLKPGLSTEADVRDAMGRPDMEWPEANGARTLEYTRQPAGAVNYMITIDANGTMQSLEQVLNAQNFARIQPGMHYDQVRRILGKPAKDVWYPLKNEHHFDWRYQENPSEETRIFTVVTTKDRQVLRSMSGPDYERSDMYRR